MPPAPRHTAGCPSGQRERSVKPSAQPTLVRTQHLPHPGETARSLHKRGPAGRFLLVTACIRVCHYGSMHGSVHVHMVYSVRAKTSGAYNRSLCRIRARFVPLFGRQAARLTGECRASRSAGPILRRPARDGRRASLVRTRGRGRLPHRPSPSHRGCHGGGERVRVARRVEGGKVPWRATLSAASCHKGFPVSLSGLDLVEPVMYLSCTRRVPAQVTRRITRPQGYSFVAAASEVPGRPK